MSTTTLFPCSNSGPDDDEYGPEFPASTGRGMLRQLREAQGLNFAKPKTVPKKFIKSAEGSTTKKSVKVKTSAKPKNLRKKPTKKAGIFGETYTAPPDSKGKGVRVAESRHLDRISAFGEGGPGSGRHSGGGAAEQNKHLPRRRTPSWLDAHDPNTLPVQVAGGDKGSETFPNLAAAKASYPNLDPTKSSGDHTWAMRGEIDGKPAMRFETHKAYNEMY